MTSVGEKKYLLIGNLLTVLVHGEKQRFAPGASADFDWYVHPVSWVDVAVIWV